MTPRIIGVGRQSGAGRRIVVIARLSIGFARSRMHHAVTAEDGSTTQRCTGIISQDGRSGEISVA
jgi:hypothetical protein